jgi:hypothetical protein
MATSEKDKKPQSLASMAGEIRELRKKVEARNAGTDEASQKQKERMAALKKRMNEDVRNEPNAGGRRMPNRAEKPQESKSSAQQASKSPAATTKVEQANFKDDSNIDWNQKAGSEKVKGGARVQKGIAKGRMNKYAGEGRQHSYNNYMAEEEKKKKGESNVVGS